MSDSLWHHESQHTRPPCPSPTPGVHSKSCPSSQWCHPAISSSVVPFSSWPQSFPASVQFSRSVMSDSLRPQASLPVTIYQILLKIMSIESVMPSSHLVLCCSLCLLPSIFPSISIFSEELALLIRGPKCWSFSFSISPSNERLDFQHSGLIFFGIDWFDLLAFQETLKSLLQHHNLKAPILWHSAFFMVQLSHSYMTTRKTITWTIWTFVGKVMSLLFNILSTLVITFLPRSKRLLISWLQLPSGVILEPPKIKSDTVSQIIYHEVMGPDAMILVFWMLSFKPTFSLSSFTFHQEAL